MEKTENSPGFIRYTVVAVCVVLISFHLYATFSGVVIIAIQRAVHLGLILILAVLIHAEKKFQGGKKISFPEWIVNAAIIITAVVSAVYLSSLGNDIGLHIAAPARGDIIIGAALLISLLEATRRSIGNVLAGLALVMVVYSKFGAFFPGGLGHKGYSAARIASNLFLSTDGIYGTPLGVSASVVVMFVIFGAFLRQSGAGNAFISTAFSLFGRVRGGPAKVAVVSSALFGSISGSSVANVVTTGTLTIPLMKKVGYKPHFAGAVEAAASTGGQIMPPVMGAAAFLIAQVLSVPYIKVVEASLISAFIYFYTVFVVVDMQAVRDGLKGLPATELPNLRKTLRESWFLMLPVFVLIVMLVIVRVTPNRAALYCIPICVVVSWFGKKDRMKIKEILQAVSSAGKDMITIALACATAGVVIGMMGQTGLGLKLSSLLVEWSHGNLMVLLVLTMITAVILGMGLPTTGVYVILSVLVAPALIKMNVSKMAAHLFVFYFGCISAITPPVALASYAGATIAGANMNVTGLSALKIGMSGFILPFLFVFQPGLLAMGSITEIAWSTFVAVFGVTALSASINAVPYNILPVRIIFAAGACLLIDIHFVTDIIGIGMVLAGLVWGHIRSKKT